MKRRLGGLALILTVAACGDTSAEPSTKAEPIVTDATPVEIKMMVAEVEDGPDLIGLRADDAEIREITFYDSLTLTLFEDGTILRSRHVKNGADDSTVKKRPLVASKVDEAMLEENGFKCELDKSVGVTAVSSCSLTKEQASQDIAGVVAGDDPIKRLFTSDQRAFLEAHQEGFPDAWQAIRPLGPIAAEVWKLEPESLGTKVTVERWDVPGGSRSLEVSVKVLAGEAPAFEEKLVAWATERGLHKSTQQETKTKAALRALVAAARK